MTMVTGQQAMAVEVGPILRERTQMWARLAGQAVSFEDINLVQAAFLALWWEADAAKTFEVVTRYVADGKMSWVVRWLAYVIDELDVAIQTWQRVLDLLSPDTRRMSRFVKDTSIHLNELMQMLGALREQTIAVCQMYDVQLPENCQVCPTGPDMVNLEA